MSNRHAPPWRDRIQRPADTPAHRVPFRESTGLWKALLGKQEADEENRRFHRRLPASWRSWVEESSLPIWLKGAALWLLQVPRWIYIVVGSVVVVSSLTLLITVVSIYSYLSKPVPIPTPVVGSATQTGHVYAADGSLLADLHGAINRQSVPLAQMSTPLKQAVLAAEDGTFYKHKALDFGALLRAAVTDVFAGHWVEGGSTITQQYVKLNYLGQQRTFGRKVQEARVAYQMERRLSKDQILELYLNTVYFGRGAYGVQAAALTFYGKNASELDATESSLLAGLIQSPSTYNPDVNTGAAEVRRQYVVDRMQALGFLTGPQAAAVRTAKTQLIPPPVPNTIAYKYPWFVETVRSYLFQKYGEALVLGGGLNVQTTLDPHQQDLADQTVAKVLPNPADPSAAVVSVDPQTGYVTSMVAGRDNGTEKFNLATQGRRQPGSAMKPFVLIAALEHGISPLTVYNGPSQVCLAGWLPNCQVNTYNNEAFGSITLETATIFSVNTVYAQLIMQVGPATVVDVANRMGVPGPKWLLPSVPGCRPAGAPNCTTHLTAEPSLALGSNDVSPLEMASAYATLADHGVYHEPKFVSKVTNASGNVLESGPGPSRQAVDPAIATQANRILHEVVTMGTGTAANLGRPEAGKTGTTSDYRNAWFVGYTPELATAVWVGYRDANQPLLNVEGVAQMAGGTIPAKIWATYMKAALPPASNDTLNADATTLGLINAPNSSVTSTVVGTQTVTSSVTTGSPAVCVLLPSTTAVGPLPSPVTGTGYNVYRYLRCSGGSGSSSGNAPAPAGVTSTDTAPPDTSSPLPAPLPTGGAGPTDLPSTEPVPSPTPPRCILGLLCG
ncbi:MAG TPA: transglycosylase domain-containing protein [Actinomycetota bacterium]